MITLPDLSQYLQNLLSPADFTDYCPNGLQVEGKQQIKKLCFAVSASLAAIKETSKRRGDALIVHHGIFWQKDSPVICNTKREKLRLLLSHDISLFAYHLPLDAHTQVGNNWRAARDLGLKKLEPFQGIGVQGKVPSVSTTAFQKKLEIYYGHPAHVALGGKKEITSVAIISGGAHRSIEAAADAGVDCFITGSFDEPVWDIAHERKINFFALGHYATEKVGILALKEEMKKQWNLPCEFLDLFNPF